MTSEEIIQGLYRGDSKAIKEVIKILEREPDEDAISRSDAIRVASGYCHPANIAKELAKLPPVQPQQEPCEDWNAVLDELNRIGRNAFKDDTDYDNLFNFISGLPNVKQEPKTGHWIKEFNDLEGEVKFTCSSCGKYQPFITNFCYHCGSDNRGRTIVKES